MADAQIDLRTGSVLLARNATQEELYWIMQPVAFARIGDLVVATDLIASAYMLDETHAPITLEERKPGLSVDEIHDIMLSRAEAERAGHTYSEADLTKPED